MDNGFSIQDVSCTHPPTPFPAKARKGAYLKQSEHFPPLCFSREGEKKGVST